MKLHLYPQQFEYLFELFYGMKLAGANDEVFNSIFADLDFEAKEYYGDRYKEVTKAYNDQFQLLNTN
ncbi:hypothetical protein [Flavobacterium sp.]|uniref:hypothetical protein n=1 Tax=Flavobacterium sp. TaxID=239 RepID=UPI00391E04D3